MGVANSSLRPDDIAFPAMGRRLNPASLQSDGHLLRSLCVRRRDRDRAGQDLVMHSRRVSLHHPAGPSEGLNIHTS